MESWEARSVSQLSTPREVGLKRPGFGCRGAIAKRGVGPDGVVVNPPAFSQDLHFLERVEDLTVEELVAQLRVEAFTVPVLPWAAGFDIECLCSRIRQPLPQIFGYELRAIVRTDMLWNAPSSP